jgi:hypothetical protein
MMKDTAMPAPMGIAKNAGDATNFDKIPTAGFAASMAPSKASFSSWRSPSDSRVSASRPPSAMKNVCRFGKDCSFIEALVDERDEIFEADGLLIENEFPVAIAIINTKHMRNVLRQIGVIMDVIRAVSG